VNTLHKGDDYDDDDDADDDDNNNNNSESANVEVQKSLIVKTALYAALTVSAE
jgi:hypothetical protein